MSCYSFVSCLCLSLHGHLLIIYWFGERMFKCSLKLVLIMYLKPKMGKQEMSVVLVTVKRFCETCKDEEIPKFMLHLAQSKIHDMYNKKYIPYDLIFSSFRYWCSVTAFKTLPYAISCPKYWFLMHFLFSTYNPTTLKFQFDRALCFRFWFVSKYFLISIITQWSRANVYIHRNRAQ